MNLAYDPNETIYVHLECPDGHVWAAWGVKDESGFTPSDDAKPGEDMDCPECGQEAVGMA